jgi:hypothetical protein
MDNVYLRLLTYMLVPALGALFAFLATVIPGASYDATAQTVTVGVEQLAASLAGLIFGMVSSLQVFRKWGVK